MAKLQIMKCRDLGFNDDFIVIEQDREAAKKKMMEHILEKHKEEFEILSEMHQEEIRTKMDFLLTRGCGCGVKEL
ncbi:hypothetical protein [Methanomethylovorans sp.]|uniref:hypothetical protein n=1 Tax=Methanomethylovorans sp. TaxID=2758717 RepID=UPI002FDDEDCE